MAALKELVLKTAAQIAAQTAAVPLCAPAGTFEKGASTQETLTAIVNLVGSAASRVPPDQLETMRDAARQRGWLRDDSSASANRSK
jgi:hypothetical protein